MQNTAVYKQTKKQKSFCVSNKPPQARERTSDKGKWVRGVWMR